VATALLGDTTGGSTTYMPTQLIHTIIIFVMSIVLVLALSFPRR
jgi:hypothetical protein